MATLAERMQADALEAQRYSRKHMVLELDFSAASIGELEEAAGTVEYAVPGGKSAENIDMLTRIWGAYVGESLRKACQGEWIEQEGGRVAITCGNATVYPHEHVRRRLTEGPEHDLVRFYADAAGEAR